MKINQIIESRDLCHVCGQTPCNCTHVTESQVNEFAPAGGGTPPRGPRTPGSDPWGGNDSGEDPYGRPDPRPYRRSIDFFGRFEADHFDEEVFDDKTGVFKGYWFDREAEDGKIQIAYFKFDDPKQAARDFDDSPGMGWYYEPQNESVAEGVDEKDIINSGMPLKYIEQQLQQSGLEKDIRYFIRWAIDNGSSHIEDAIELGDKAQSQNPEISYGLQRLKQYLGQGMAEGMGGGEYGRVLDALKLYYPRVSMEELNTPGYHKVIANKANVPVEYAAKVIDDFVKPYNDEYDDEQGVAENIALAGLNKEFGKFTRHFDRMDQDPAYAAKWNKQNTDRLNREVPDDDDMMGATDISMDMGQDTGDNDEEDMREGNLNTKYSLKNMFGDVKSLDNLGLEQLNKAMDGRVNIVGRKFRGQEGNSFRYDVKLANGEWYIMHVVYVHGLIDAWLTDEENNKIPLSKFKSEGIEGEIAGGVVGSVVGGAAGSTLGPIGGAIGSALGGSVGSAIGSRYQDGKPLKEKQQLDEIAPLLAAGARLFMAAAPKIAQVVGRAGRAGAQGAGQTARAGAEIAAKNAGQIGLGAAAYEIGASVADIAKDITAKVGQAVDEKTIFELATLAFKYAIPAGIVLAIMYGGKKAIDSLFSDKEPKPGVAEGKPKEKEADYGPDYQDMVARVKKLAGLGPLRTVYDPQKRVYKNVPTAVQPKKEQR